MLQVNRRQFLTLGAATTGSILLTHCNRSQTAMLPGASPTPVTVSTNGLLDIALVARASQILLAGRKASLLSYNGQIPGPRLEARPGDTVRIRLTNQLADLTNLHYHGLHVPSTGNADNIFLSVPPGENLTYEFTLPKNHPAGTFYYHPHHHEHVAEQVFAGLGGIFVVRGDLDEIPEVKAAQEQFLFFKDFALDVNGRVPPPGHMQLMRGREGTIVTVNGQVNPMLTVPKGGLLRLRMINASTSRFYRLKLEQHPFYLIATDGGAIAEPVELPELLLSPGERAEVLVRGERESGQYRLLNLPYNRGGMGMMGGGGMGMGGMHGNAQAPTANPQLLATLTYQGSVAPLPLPQQLLQVETLPLPSQTRRIELSMSMGMMGGMGGGRGMGMKFTFNGKTFDPQRVDIQTRLGSIEDWELVNVDPDGMDHPFHLHVNPFQVVSRNSQPETYRAWKDTVLVRGQETVRIRIPFRDFAGKTVYHCHILDHEDLGMMGMVEMQA
jgi:FtsP/CotA-like multicopper oxidase with cupredoxin domain